MWGILNPIETPLCYKLQYKSVKVPTGVTIVGVHFLHFADVEKENTTGLPFLKSHFLSQCEDGFLFFSKHLEFHYRLIGVGPAAHLVYLVIWC